MSIHIFFKTPFFKNLFPNVKCTVSTGRTHTAQHNSTLQWLQKVTKSIFVVVKIIVKATVLIHIQMYYVVLVGGLQD
jgi:hypothetical protein